MFGEQQQSSSLSHLHGGGERSKVAGKQPHERVGKRRAKSKGKDHEGGGHASSDPVVETIEQRLAYLRWRKGRNEGDIKEALRLSKQIKERDLLAELSLDRNGEKVKWIEEVVTQELARPMTVSDSFLSDYQKQRLRDERHYMNDAELHMKSLDRLETALRKLEEKEHEKALARSRSTNNNDNNNTTTNNNNTKSGSRGKSTRTSSPSPSSSLSPKPSAPLSPSPVHLGSSDNNKQASSPHACRPASSPTQLHLEELTDVRRMVLKSREKAEAARCRTDELEPYSKAATLAVLGVHAQKT